MTKTTNKPLGTPRQVRFPKDIEEDLQKIADVNEIDWTDAVRQAARAGVPVLKKRFADLLKQAA